MDKNRIPDVHRRRNQSTQPFRSSMSDHRKRVMELLRDARHSQGGRLALLGAGNANDVDLGELVKQFESVTLIDLDREALEIAVEGLSLEQMSKVSCFGDADVTGIFSSLVSLDVSSAEGVQAVIDQASSASLPTDDRFDVVASTCLLSQLIDSINLVIPEQHPHYLALVLAVRNRHLEQIAELLLPGGTGVLISDFVGSGTAPELATLNASELIPAAQRWISQYNFFTGCNPNAVHQFLLESSTRLGIAQVSLKGPWCWNIGTKLFAVFAAVFNKQDEPGAA